MLLQPRFCERQIESDYLSRFPKPDVLPFIAGASGGIHNGDGDGKCAFATVPLSLKPGALRAIHLAHRVSKNRSTSSNVLRLVWFG